MYNKYGDRMKPLIVIEGTDCSGKKTQTKLLKDHLEKDNISVEYFSFPNYNSPTGKIIENPYLGKYEKSYFKEDILKIDPKVSSLYFAADRRYHLEKIKNMIEKNIVILDRYVDSNMAYQGSRLDRKNRIEMYHWLEKLEYDLLELPRPNLTIFLYVPLQYMRQLSQNREKLDNYEKNIKLLQMAEASYLELAEFHHYQIVHCVKDNKLRTIQDIHKEIYQIVTEFLESGGSV